MLETLHFQDSELDLINASKQDIIDSITLEDVKNFLEGLGVTEIQINEEKQYLICPTICHNPVNEESSMKLYWYQDNKIFRCYTECNEAMSIFTLYKKYMALNYYPISDEDAVEYVKRSLNHIIAIRPQERKKKDVIDFNRYKFVAHLPTLKEYNENVLQCFTHYYHPVWLQEGITKQVMDEFNILYSISNNSIVIPQRDLQGRLIGVRERIFDPEKIAKYGKYHPITVGNITYSYSETFALYGIYENQAAIRRRRSAILVEGEKSVMKDAVFHNELANSVAVCTSHTNKYHISMLVDILGVNEIIIAFDKEYDDWRSEEAKIYKKKIEQICKTYRGRASFSYIWDYENLLEKKDSPFDKGKDIFDYLYKNRVKVR